MPDLTGFLSSTSGSTRADGSIGISVGVVNGIGGGVSGVGGGAGVLEV